MQPLRVITVHAAICSLAMALPAAAQQFESATTAEPQSAFAAVAAEGTPLSFSLGKFTVPEGGHLQGIQMRRDADGRILAFISHDSQTVGYFLVVAFPADFTAAGEVIHVQEFPSDGQQPPLRHAGGIQLAGDVLVVGLEDNQDKTRSEVQFWNVADPLKPALMPHLTIPRSGAPKDKTAGAVGIVAHAGRYLLAVANWDSRAIDFYRSGEKPLTDLGCQFELFKRWTNAAADKSTWRPDPICGSYQSMSLLSSSDGRLFLAGFDTAFPSQDVVDLFALDPDAESPRLLEKIAQRRLRFPDGIQFRFGSGLWIAGGEMSFLASQRSLLAETELGIAQPER